MYRKSHLHKLALVYIEITILKVFLLSFCLHTEKSKSKLNAKAGSSATEAIRAKTLRILIVDDEDEYRRSMALKLKRIYGVTVEDVESGDLAIEKINGGNSYDLIFLDIMMPGKTGIEVYRELITIKPDARVAMMSAYSDSEHWKKAERLGIDLLHKPFSEEKLIEVLLKV